MYITFEEYEALGGKCDQATFPTLEMQARYKLDYWTQDRITEPDERVRLCMKLIIDTFFEKENGEEDVASFSNDGISVSFADAKTFEQKMSDVHDAVVEILPVELISAVIA